MTTAMWPMPDQEPRPCPQRPERAIVRRRRKPREAERCSQELAALVKHPLFFGQAFPSSARRNWSRWLSSCHVSIVTIASIVMRPRVGCRQPRCRCSGVKLRSSASDSSRRLRNAASAWTASFLGYCRSSANRSAAPQRVCVDPRLIVEQDRVDAHEVHLFDVPQVADDLVGRPVLAVRSPREGGLTLAARGGEILGGAGHAT